MPGSGLAQYTFQRAPIPLNVPNRRRRGAGGGPRGRTDEKINFKQDLKVDRRLCLLFTKEVNIKVHEQKKKCEGIWVIFESRIIGINILFGELVEYLVPEWSRKFSITANMLT